MGPCSIFVRSLFASLVLAFAASLIQAQDPPKLPPDNSAPPDLSQPPFAPTFVPRVAVHRMRVPSGPFRPTCPKGYQYAERPDGLVGCIKDRNSCVVWPMNSRASDVFLYDARAVVVRTVEPVYPQDSIQDHEQGIAEFTVSRAGNPKLFMWIQPSDSLSPQRLQDAARAALDQWSWKPYSSRGQAFNNWTTRVYFKFEITPDGPRVQTFLREPPKKSR